MSTAASTAPNLTHLPHTPHAPHPIPLREQAFTLHCQGLRSPAISQALGVPERTIRAWIAAALDELKDDLQLSRKEQLLLAVARQNQLTASAWHQFEAEAATRSALLDTALGTLHILLHAADSASDGTTSATRPARPLHLHLPASTPAPRYLSLVLQANKETNRLLGLHTLARLHLLTQEPASDDTVPVATPDIPAESATASSSPATDSVGASGGRPAASMAPSRIPAESATAPARVTPSPAFRSLAPASVVHGRDSNIPAKTATDSQSAPGSVRSAACSKAKDGQADLAAARHPGAVLTAGSPPPESATRIAAKTATVAPMRKTPKPWMM